MKNDSLYLQHIRDACEQIGSYLEGYEETFFSDKRTQDAVIRNLEIIGEATKQLSEDLRTIIPMFRGKLSRG